MAYKGRKRFFALLSLSLLFGMSLSSCQTDDKDTQSRVIDSVRERDSISTRKLERKVKNLIDKMAAEPDSLVKEEETP